MKYTIRYQPDAAGIESAHWMVWRPGMYEDPFRGFRAFAHVPTYKDALAKVQGDIIKSMLEFADYTGQNNVDLVEAGWWWAAHNRNEWRDQFSIKRSQKN